jgi:pimeloyl-ACP methyl ester carboxylesterase
MCLSGFWAMVTVNKFFSQILNQHSAPHKPASPQVAELDVPQDQWLMAGGYGFCYRLFAGKNIEAVPTLIMSGAFQNFSSWNSTVKHFLAQGKTVILLNLPGTGHCDPLPPHFGIDFLAVAIRQVLDHAGIEKVNIISPSYSTPAGYLFAQWHPERVRNLLLCGTMEEIPKNLRPYVARSITTLREGRMEQFADEVLGISGPQAGHGLLCTDPDKPVARRKMALRILYSQLVSLTDDDRLRYEYNTLRLLLSNECIDVHRPPTAKTLIFTGEYDSFTKPEYCRKIASALPDAAFTTIQNADHMFHIEQFPVTCELFYRFSYDFPLSDIEGIHPLEEFSNPMTFKNSNAVPHSTYKSDDLVEVA